MDLWQSKVPAAIDALVATFTTADGLQDVTVLDGPSVSQARVQEIVSVGYTGMEDQADVDAVAVGEGLGGTADREQFSIRCVAAVTRGSTEMAAARKRAYELFGASAVALAANRTLNGTVLRAMVGSHSLTQYQTDQGAQAAVNFTVDCDSYTR